MAARNYTNTAPPVALTVAVDAAATTLTVNSMAGYPEPPFTIGLERGTSNEEVVLCTAKSGTAFTVTRAYDGTTGKAHAIGTSVEHAVAAIDYAEARDHRESTGGHGVVEVVGTTEKQTLTNKIISGATNTIKDLAASAITSGVLALARIPRIPWTHLDSVPIAYNPAPHKHPFTDITGAVNADTIKGRSLFVQAAEPSGASNGDIWFKI